MSYKCPNALSHKSIVGLCKNNLKAEVRSLIVGAQTKTMVQLIEVAIEVKGILTERKRNSPKMESSSPTITLAKGKGKKEAFNSIWGRNNKKEVFYVQNSSCNASAPNQAQKKVQSDPQAKRDDLERRKNIKFQQ